MVYVVKLGSLVPTGPDGAAVGWSAAINGSVAVGGSRQAGYGPTYFFRGVGSQCPSDMPELDRGVTPNLAMPCWHASAQQRGHAKPGDALLACQPSTGGVAPAWR